MASNGKKSNMIVGLDIGTSKVVCIVGKYNEERKLEIVAEMTEEYMKEEKKITSQFDNDPLLKLKSREVDLRAMENERKRDNDEAQIDLARARLMQQGEIAEDKMDQNEDLAKLRAGVSLAKTGVKQAAIVTDDN